MENERECDEDCGRQESVRASVDRTDITSSVSGIQGTREGTSIETESAGCSETQIDAV